MEEVEFGIGQDMDDLMSRDISNDCDEFSIWCDRDLMGSSTHPSLVFLLEE